MPGEAVAVEFSKRSCNIWAGLRKGEACRLAFYADVERLGEGTWSTLYRAVRTSDGCRILLDVLNAEQCRGDPAALLANQLELGKVARSDAVLAPLGTSTFDGRPALELQDSGAAPLEGLLGTAWAVDAFLELAIHLSWAVGELHERGIVHGALQPRHLLVNRDTGGVLLSGLWSAQRATRDGVVHRPAALLEGCLPYMSPEQTGRLNRSVDRRTDLYSLGLIFFELLTGRPPFETADATGWVHCHLARKPPAPRELVPSIPGMLSNIVLRLLEKDPDERYQSVAGLLQDLRQCQAAVGAGGAIAPFPLGRADVSNAFTIPQKVYGRDSARASLLERLEAVASGAPPRLVLISGPSGVGKSSLVFELQRPCAVRGVRFIAAKFEQHSSDVPYAAVIDALRELSLDVLAGGSQQIEDDRQRIAAAASVNAALLCKLIPELCLILGPQPPPGELPAGEIEKRLRAALHRCFAAFGTRARPMLIFLDDIQWSDASSVELLGDLAIDTDLRHVALVATYRDDVEPLHPLRRSLERMSAAGVAVEELALGPLSMVDLRQLVADVTRAPRAEAAQLAQVIHRKTGGNPFFVAQLLSELHDRALIAFDAQLRRWRWDISAVLAHPCSDNVTDLLVAKLRDLPAECQATLGVGAYLGREFDVDTLSLAMDRDPGPALSTALDRGLLLTLDRKYRFPHDRVHEAAYSLIPESERAATHLRIGQLLLAASSLTERGEQIFDIVHHMNRGSSLLARPAERERLAELLLSAGRRARSSGSQVSACGYFAAGSALLGADVWERRYELAFALVLGHAECELATGELAAAEERLGRLVHRARGFLDQAAVACARGRLSVIRSEFLRCIELLLGALASAGIELSLDPSEESIRGEYEHLRAQLGDSSVERLVELGEADARTQAIMELLFMLADASTSINDRLMRVAACRMASLGLEGGHCDASAPAYVYLGQMVGPYFGDYDTGFRFARLGLTLLERRRQSRFRDRVLVMAGAFVYPWTRPLPEAAELLRRGLDAAAENGDPTFAWLSLSAQASHSLLSGASLVEVDQLCKRAAELVRKAGLGPFFRDMIIVCERLVRSLRGLTRGFPSFDEGDFDEARFEAHLASDPALTITHGWYWIRKLQAHYHGGDYAGALAAGAHAEPLLWTTGFATERVEFHFYRALALAAHFELATAEGRPHQRASLGEHARALEAWGRGCPANFSSRAALVAAEIARIDGDDARAAQGYEQAIRLATEASSVSVLALGYETAARFYRARGFLLIADTYLNRAGSSYRRWGADGKVRQLEQQYPALALREAFGEGALLGVRAEQLDLLAVVTASQKISGMVVREQLLSTLLQIVLEHGGARHARLVLAGDPSDGSGLQVAAEAAIDDAAPLLRLAPRVPASIIEYVQRTGSLVLLDDATTDAGRFARDPHFANGRARSLLCLPLRRHGTVVGVLYLDNDLTPGVFTPERLVALELLATQAAVSLQNADLLARERAAREDAQLDRRRALLLGEATALLSEFADRAALSRVIRLICDHGLADWVLLDVVGGGATQRGVYGHRDAAGEALLADLERRYPAPLGAALLGAHEREAEAPVHRASLSDEQLRSHCVDDEHAALLRKLGSRSFLIVPLVARGIPLGTLSLMAGSPHHFQPGDIDVSVELGRRLAMAIDGARLAELENRLLQSQKMEAIGRLAGGVAHDFNNLLTVILSYSQVAGDGLASEDELREGMAEILEAGKRGAQLTRQLLSFSRHQLVETRVIDLNRVTTDVETMLGTLLGSRIELAFRLSERLWSTRADPGQMEQVLMNLAANARDAMPQGGRLLIETANVELDEAYAREHVSVTAGDYVMLAVTDSGCGIEREVQARMFEPFFTTKERGKGTGLGLATVFGIVRQSRGHVAVDSEVGRGTTFRIYLPRCATPADEQIAASAPSAPASGYGTETILLVEDDEQVRRALCAILQQRGYLVLEAAGPGDALLISEQHPASIDLLLSDFMMPLMTGPELAERVIAARPTIRLLFISGYTDTAMPRLAVDDYRVDCLQKPFTADRLIQSIRKVLDLQSANGAHCSG
jgi:predicted ATPase/signal transduction histidine kinase/CheY-like chemotaxis protein